MTAEDNNVTAGDAQLVSEVLSIVRENGPTGIGNDRKMMVGTCLDMARRVLKARFRQSHRLKANDALSIEQVQELNDLYNRNWPAIEERVKDMCLKFEKRKKSLGIKQASAKAYLDEALQDIGLERFDVYCNGNRICVMATLPSGYKFKFYLTYKSVLSREVDGQIEEIKIFIKTVEELPVQVRLWK